MTAPKVGPLTQAELQSVWESAVDTGFSEPLKQAGEGNGFEVYTQAWAVGARVSQAIDQTTQSMFVLPWSGQSGPPASGGAVATVTLSLTRTKLLSQTLVLAEGTFVEEQIVDWGEGGGVAVLTGRRYLLTANAVFLPGQQGPVLVVAEAKRIGTGYNNPFPGTLIVVDQPGTRYTNVDGTVRGTNYPAGTIGPTTLARAFLDALDQSDAFIPQHAGQYVQFTVGANAGKTFRALNWLPPNLSVAPQTGGTLEVALDQSVASFTGDFTGTFVVGESLTLKNGAAISGYGVLLGAGHQGTTLILAFQRTSGIAVTSVIGNSSGATATIDVLLGNLDVSLESFAAGWKVLDWVADWGLTCTNPLSPQGGKHAMLDALGREKDIDRSPGEDDDDYRIRISQLADVVSPNAIRRALNRAIPGVPWCFREAGLANYPGFFYQLFQGPGGGGDFYDYDWIFFTGTVTGEFLPGERVTQTVGGIVATGVALVDRSPAPVVPGPPGAVNMNGVAKVSGTFVLFVPIVGARSGATLTPTTATAGLLNANRFRVYFDYLDMRAYFYIGVPPLSAGEFGFSFDNYPTGAFDAAPYDDFFDGGPYLSARTYLAVYAAMEKVRAGGTGWRMYLETGPCP